MMQDDSRKIDGRPGKFDDDIGSLPDPNRGDLVLESHHLCGKTGRGP